MKKRKHPNLPNGYGSIKHLSGNRTNPYAVYPPAKERNEDGIYLPVKALCYVDDWYTGFAVLTAYKAGTYEPGMELELSPAASSADLDSLSRRILADSARIRRATAPEGKEQVLFSDVYSRFREWKYNGKRVYSTASIRSTDAAYKNCARLHDRVYAEITGAEMQAVIDDCPLKHASLELILSLLKQMARFAKAERIIPDLSAVDLLRIGSPDDDEHGVPFTDAEINVLWEHRDEEAVQTLLVMIFTGLRVSELDAVEIDLENGCLRGGLKTEAGRNRIVPVHPAIASVVSDRAHSGHLLGVRVETCRNRTYKTLARLGIDYHTPHDCRHTFSRLCEKYGVRENDRKRMLGHTFQRDVTNQIYGHRDVDDLRAEIEKIPTPPYL